MDIFEIGEIGVEMVEIVFGIADVDKNCRYCHAVDIANIVRMVHIVLKARFAAERAHATEAADRGSEPGNFDTEPFDTEGLCTDQLDDDFDLGASTLSGGS